MVLVRRKIFFLQFSDEDTDPTVGRGKKGQLDPACYKVLDIKISPLLGEGKVGEGQKNEPLKTKIYVRATIFITADAKNSMRIVHGFIYLTLSPGGRPRFTRKVLLVLFPSR